MSTIEYEINVFSGLPVILPLLSNKGGYTYAYVVFGAVLIIGEYPGISVVIVDPTKLEDIIWVFGEVWNA